MKLLQLYHGALFACYMIKNLLENEGIESMIQDEVIGSRGGSVWRPAGGVRLVVSDEYYDKALSVVRAFEASQKEE